MSFWKKVSEAPTSFPNMVISSSKKQDDNFQTTCMLISWSKSWTSPQCLQLWGYMASCSQSHPAAEQWCRPTQTNGELITQDIAKRLSTWNKPRVSVICHSWRPWDRRSTGHNTALEWNASRPNYRLGPDCCCHWMLFSDAGNKVLNTRKRWSSLKTNLVLVEANEI